MSGCRTIPRQIAAQADRRYAGVRLSEWQASLAAKEKTLRVLLVHGMNNHPFGIVGNKPNLQGNYTYVGLRRQLGSWDSAEPSWKQALIADATKNGWRVMIDRIARRFGHVGPDVNSEFTLIEDPVTGRVLGYLFTRDFPAGEGRAGVKFYVASWALSVVELKEQEFGSWGLLNPEPGTSPGDYIDGRVSDTQPVLNKHRAKLNQHLKLHTVNWGLADPSLYLTTAGAPIRRVVAHALREMAGEATGGDRAIIVAESLGSTIALDCAKAFLEGNSPEGVTGWGWGDAAPPADADVWVDA